MAKITLSTVKKFIKDNKENLHINVKSSFDGMTDCCESRNDGFKPIKNTERNLDRSLGINGAWFVGSSRDYFTPYNENGFTGIEVYNSCGTFILAVKK